jgi:cell division protein YceG involved in septum cleavage
VKPFVTSRLAPNDWSGSGTGTVRVEVHSGEGSAQIGATLAKAGVVRSETAFVHAAKENTDSALIQPGIYTLRSHMSAAGALTLMLDPHRGGCSAWRCRGTTERNTMAKLAGVLACDDQSIGGRQHHDSRTSRGVHVALWRADHLG